MLTKLTGLSLGIIPVSLPFPDMSHSLIVSPSDDGQLTNPMYQHQLN